MAKESPDYLSYLLRLWRVDGEAGAWRASLESPFAHETERFGSLDELFDGLRRRTSDVCGPQEDDRESDCAESEL